MIASDQVDQYGTGKKNPKHKNPVVAKRQGQVSENSTDYSEFKYRWFSI